jgi:hypothetical protein
MYMMTRPHTLALGALIASASVALSCAQILGDYEIVADSAETTSSSSSAAAASSGAGGGSSSGGTLASGTGTGSASTGAGGQVDGGQDPCGPGSTGDFKDDFDDKTRGQLWDAYPDGSSNVFVSEQNQELTITTDGTANLFGGYRSVGPLRSLIGCSMAVEVKEIPGMATGYAVRLELVDDNASAAPNYLRISQVGPDMVFHHYLNDVEESNARITYDPIKHRWWRLSESNKKTYFETSPNGKDWTPRLTIDTPAFVSAVYANLTMGAKQDMPPGQAVFDNLNIAPP